jgi:hypothetical protein
MVSSYNDRADTLAVVLCVKSPTLLCEKSRVLVSKVPPFKCKGRGLLYGVNR